MRELSELLIVLVEQTHLFATILRNARIMNSFFENKVRDISAAGPAGQMSLYQLYLLTGCEKISVNITTNHEAACNNKDQSSALI